MRNFVTSTHFVASSRPSLQVDISALTKTTAKDVLNVKIELYEYNSKKEIKFVVPNGLIRDVGYTIPLIFLSRFTACT